MSTPKQKRTTVKDAVRFNSPQMQELVRDANRWRALMSSERIRVMGYAGFKDGKPRTDNSYLHIGVEFWNKHPSPHPSEQYPQEADRELFTVYIDSMVPKQDETYD